MKTTSLPRFIAHAALFAAFAASTFNTQAQTPAVSTLRETTDEITREERRVQQVIERAENHFKQGELNLKDNRREQARDDFDKAVDAILESGMDVRGNPRLREFYLQLVERVYRVEVPLQQQYQQVASAPQEVAFNNASMQDGKPAAPPVAVQQTTGFREQKFEPSPLDELSKLVLTEEEKKVTPEKIAEQEEEINTLDLKFRPNSLIQGFINYYQGRGRSTMESGLRRSGQFMTMARRIFREEGVPEDIAWLGQVESAWRPTARSWAAASGLWQFIPGTGSRFGLRQNAWVDERNSFEKATRASAKYLKFLANRYHGNWELAIGAYNTGEGNIDRAISRAGVADFWRVYPFIAQETRNYVPNILATILITKNPEKYGFGNIPRMAPIEKTYDLVKVPSSTSLQLIASLTDTSTDFLRSINPELRRDVTPPGESYVVRVPGGRGNQFVALLKRIPLERRNTTARVISVGPGEDLASVAARTGTNVAVLQQWNNGVDLKSGGRLVVPSGSSMKLSGMTRSRGNVAPVGSNLMLYRAKAGETVAQIASRYNASPDEVARLNMVTANEPLAAGKEVRIPSRGPAVNAPSRPAARRR
ncbi:MAG TPA: transglycosylase SLT domain-containing protein [Pyrinomonadaceae bacterium]|nr:transglycosylase SLT domain-containing protein [Pyrinomonadaceae bacterium]